MYYKEQIEHIVREYLDNKVVFEKLIAVLIPLINAQLRKNYSSLSEYWDDMRQEVLLKTWKNRKGLKFIKTKLYSMHYYARIRTHLFRAAKKIKRTYNV